MNSSTSPPLSARRLRLRTAAAGLVILAVVAVFFAFRQEFSLDRLARHESVLRSSVERYPLYALAVAFVIYLVATAFAIPVATILSLLYAWLFGFWQALLVVSFASTGGAAGSFLFSRYLLADLVRRRFASQLTAFQDALDRDGAFYLFSLRLVPYVPFFIINLVMGLTRLRLRTFWWVSQLGMLPGTVVYLFAGSSVTSLESLRQTGVRSLVSPQLLLAFTALGLFPLLAKGLLSRWKRTRQVASTEEG